MTDDTWVRSFNNKGVYTTDKMQADGGFYGALHGNADTATKADTADGINITNGNEITLSGSSSYSDYIWLGYRAPKKVAEYKFGDGTITGGLANITEIGRASCRERV